MMDDETITFYATFSPPKPGEDLKAFCKRRRDAWNGAMIVFEERDMTAFRAKAEELFTFEAPVKGGKSGTGTSKALQRIEAEREAIRNQKVVLASTFDAHIFDGEKDGTKHKGLHSMARLKSRTPKPWVEVIERDDFGAYSAWVKLNGNENAKASSFFPDAWDMATVKRNIDKAMVAARLSPTRSSQEASAHGFSWVGEIEVDGRTMRIAGIGRGTTKDVLATAFPAVDGKFKDYN